MIESSAENAEKSFWRLAAVTPSWLIRLQQTASPWYSARCTVPWPPRAKGSSSTPASSTCVGRVAFTGLNAGGAPRTSIGS